VVVIARERISGGNKDSGARLNTYDRTKYRRRNYLPYCYRTDYRGRGITRYTVTGR